MTCSCCLSLSSASQPYLLFADGNFGIIFRSNLNGSGIEVLVPGLPGPFAIDFDYRYTYYCTGNQLLQLHIADDSAVTIQFKLVDVNVRFYVPVCEVSSIKSCAGCSY